MKKEKKLLALLLTFVLCIGMLPTSASAMDFTSGNVSSYDGNAAVFDDGTAGGAGQTVQTPTPAPETQTTPAAENEEPNVEEITVEEETPGEEVTPGVEEIPTEETTPADDSIIVEEPETTEPTPTPETTPAEEVIVDDFTSQEGDSVVVEEPEAPAEPVMVARNSVMLMDVNDSEQVTVSVEGVEETPTKDITLGVLDSNNDSLVIEGYDFLRAQIGTGDDYTIITGLYQIKDSDDYYATIEGNTTTGMRLSDTKDVVLVYETHKETYDVTYQVIVDGRPYSGDYSSVVAVSGASSVREGNELEFSAVVQDGYKLESNPATTSGTLAGSEGNIYTVTGINDDTTITLNLIEITQYKISFAGSNTTLIYQGQTHDSGNSYIHNQRWEGTYTSEKNLTFELRGLYEHNRNEKILNQLSITIDGTAKAAEIPDKVGESETTDIAKGYQVTVTKTEARERPEYSVVITNPVENGKVRGDIHIQTNYKDYNSSEVWAKQLDGVQPLAYTKYENDGSNTLITSDKDEYHDDQHSRLQPEEYTYYSRIREYESTYYIKLNGQYRAEDLYLTVLSYGVQRAGEDPVLEYTLFKDQPVSSLQQVSTSYGDYQFVIPADSTNSGSGWYLAKDGERYTGEVYKKEGWLWPSYDKININEATYPKTYYYKIGSGRHAQYYELEWMHDETSTTGEYDDIRIYIEYKPKADIEYGISYDTGEGGSEISADPKNYKIGDSAVLSETIPTREGYVFDGWYLEDAPNTLYSSGKLFTVTEDNVKYASVVDSKYVFEFHAKWTEESKATYASYQVQIFFQDEATGEYPTDPTYVTAEQGRINRIAYIIPEAMDEYLTAMEGNIDWKEKYIYDRQDEDVKIAASGTVVKIYYKLNRFKVYHTGSGKTDIVWMTDLENGKYDLTQNLTKDTLYGGYYLGYESTDDNVYNGTNATWTDPQTENGKAMHPVCGETYYVKEVPVTYLRPATYVVYDTHAGNQIVKLYLMTATDDENYKEVGFDMTLTKMQSIDSSEIVSGSLYDKVTVNKEGQEGDYATLSAQTVFGVDGYLAMSENKDAYIVKNASYVEVPYFVTLDGIKVTGDQKQKVMLMNTTYKDWKLPGIIKQTQKSTITCTAVETR